MKNFSAAHYLGGSSAGVKWSAQFFMPKHDLERVLRNPGNYFDGFRVARQGDSLIMLPEDNLVVQVGAARSADRLFQISGGTTITPLNSLTQEIVRMGVDNGTTNPVAASISSNNGGGSDTGSSTQTLRTFNSAATRASLVNTATATFNDTTTAGIGSVGYAIRRLFLSAHNANITNTTAADADNTLYSMTNLITIDLTTLPLWTANLSATITFAGT